MGASWRVGLPATPQTYTAYVEGVGSGDLSVEGSYSDYASLGRYRVSLSTGATLGVPAQTLGGVRGEALRHRLRATDAAGPVAWAAPRGLPAGLSLSADGLLSGRPARSGTVSFGVRAVSGASDAEGTVTLAVTPRPVFVTSPRLPGARARRAYRTTLALYDAPPGTRWSVGTGLPAGIVLRPSESGNSALDSGRARRAGINRFTVTVRTVHRQRTARTFTLRVR